MIDHHLIVEMNTQTQQSSFFLWVCSTHFFHSLHEQRNQERILIIIADWIPAVWHFLQWTIIELTVGLNLKICKKKIIFLNISLLFTFNLCNRTIPEIFFFFLFFLFLLRGLYQTELQQVCCVKHQPVCLYPEWLVASWPQIRLANSLKSSPWWPMVCLANQTSRNLLFFSFIMGWLLACCWLGCLKNISVKLVDPK